MIRVNLLPGGKKGAAKGGGLSLSMPDLKGLPGDKFVLGAAAVTVVVLLLAGWLFFSVRGRTAELETEIEQAQQDSARYADLIARTQQLTARRDSIAQKVEIIQEIDQDRYTWPHILDELARALPDYTWLESVQQVSGEPDIAFSIDGMSGNNFALTRFMNNLVASPFIGSVDLLSTEQEVTGQGADQQVVHHFVLEATYEQPPVEYLETVPLFPGGQEADTASAPSADR